mgnify:CR=1 FL=1
MKNVLLAAVAGITIMGTVAIATQASAEGHGVGYNGFLEYNVEADTFDGALGTYMGVAPKIDIFATVNFATIDGSEIQLDDVDLGGVYALNTNYDMYARVGFDDSLSYKETTVGLAFAY